MTMTIPGQQQNVYEAADATEFRALLGRVLGQSPLSCGQIAIKTGMPRSTAYSLPDTKRPGLPSNPDQVEAFVKACGLTPTQIDLVMDLWHKLHQEAENIRSNGEKAADDTAPPSMTKRAEAASGLPSKYERILTDSDTKFFIGDASLLRTTEGCAKFPHRTLLFSHRNTSWTELLHYVLGDERRTRRAVTLLIPITLLLLSIVCALVFLAVKMPTTTPLVVAGLLSPLLLALRKNGRKPTKKVAADD
ncbi:hypothetical protein [Amycolatopsis thailandensis]|nr:hypothetical protein [Amycolatopsis thailandensis]